MSEVAKINGRINSVESCMSVLNNKKTQVSNKIQKECLIEDSPVIEDLYLEKDNLIKQIEQTEEQVNALNAQMPLAIKADAQSEMFDIERKLKSLLDNHNEFNVDILRTLERVVDDISKGNQFEINSRPLLNKARELSSKGATIKSNYVFESVSKQILEHAHAIKLKMRNAENLRNFAVMHQRV